MIRNHSELCVALQYTASTVVYFSPYFDVYVHVATGWLAALEQLNDSVAPAKLAEVKTAALWRTCTFYHLHRSACVINP